MNQEEKQKLIELFAQSFGVEDLSEIQNDSEFIADLNAGREELLDIIKTIEEEQDIDLEMSLESLDTLTVGQFIESIEEALL